MRTPRRIRLIPVALSRGSGRWHTEHGGAADCLADPDAYPFERFRAQEDAGHSSGGHPGPYPEVPCKRYIQRFMLSLNLNRIRTAEERFEQVYTPQQFGGDDDFRVAEPISLAFDIF